MQAESRRLVQGDPTLSEVREEEEKWANLRSRLQPQLAALARAAASVDADIGALTARLAVWQATAPSVQEADLPPELLERLEKLPLELTKDRKELEARRADVLKLQAQLAELERQARESTTRLSQVRTAAVDRIFLQDAPPLWSSQAYVGDGQAGERVAEAWREQVQAAEEYVATHLGNLLLHLVMGGLLTLGLAQAGRRVHGWSEGDPALARPLAVFQAPLTMTLILSLLFLDDLYPDSPRLFNAVVIALALLPSGRLLARLLDPRYRPLLGLLIVNFLLDQVRYVLQAVPLSGRLLFLLQLAGCWLCLSLYLVRHRRERKPAPLLRVACWLALAASGLGALACLAGYVSLAEVVGRTALVAGYLAVLLAALLTVADALILLALRVPPLSLLSLVRNHRPMLRLRLRFLVGLGLGWLWLTFIGDQLTLLEPTRAGLQWVADQGLRVGELKIQLGDLFAVGVVLLAAMALSRFLRFLLEEDVYSRVELPRGVPYALSTTLHYSVLVVGVLVAMSAVGVDTSRFTVLAGALGVGLGFGLQNIVNNFVSGLILLFERPVKVGDAVRVGSQAGDLLRVGLRASVVRTWEGAEVIVPNGTLISQEVTTWSNAPRRLEIKLGVAYGTDPERMLALLEETARAHPEVAAEPRPEALFLDFGDSALLFQLRATTSSGHASRVRSQLLVALNRALKEAGIEIPFPTRTLVVAEGPPGPDANQRR